MQDVTLRRTLRRPPQAQSSSTTALAEPGEASPALAQARGFAAAARSFRERIHHGVNALEELQNRHNESGQ